MSGIFIDRRSQGAQAIEQLTSKLCFVPWAKWMHGRAGRFRFAVTWIGHDPFAPVAHRADLGISIAVLGKVYDAVDDTRLDRKLDSLIEAYQTRGASSLHPINGAGGIVFFDHRADTCFIVTDQMGFFPLYVAYPGSRDETAVCSHPDVLASSFPHPLPLDEATMAEILATERSIHPYTYYSDIRQLDSGAVYQWDARGWRRINVYWEPTVNVDETLTINDCATQLADAVKHAVRLRIRGATGKAGLLLSGGLDSRALLFSAEEAERDMVAVTFCNQRNRETAYAERLARLAGVEHVILTRDFDYYGQNAIEAVRISGGMWDISQAHTAGFSKALDALKLGVLLTGWHVDDLFKGVAVDKEVYKPLGIFPSRERLGRFGYKWYAEHFDIENKELADKVGARLKARYDGIDLTRLSLQDRMQVEFRRLAPMSRGGDGAFGTIMWRTLPLDMVTADSRFLGMFERIPANMKLNRGLWVETLARISGKAVSVPDANTGARVDGSWLYGAAAKAARKGWARWSLLKERIQRRTPDGIGTAGSWINWPRYIGSSRVIQDLWHDVHRGSGQQIRDILGYDPFALTMDFWVHRCSLFMRVMTLGVWLMHRIR